MGIQLKPEWQDNPECEALLRLMTKGFRYRGSGTVPIIYFLCGLWDGNNYRPDMQLLCRRIEDDSFNDVVTVMQLIRRTNKETHDFFEHGEVLMKTLSEHVSQTRPCEEDSIAN